NATSAPASASHAAVLAALPPARERMALGVSVSTRIGPDGTTMMSSMTSPKTRIRSAAGICDGDLGRETDVAAHEVQIHLEAAAARAFHDVAEEERRDLLAPDACGVRRGERLGQHAVVFGRVPLQPV